eukprot:scaffold37424_cov34-Phaeocystis_antarctica.AAC.1
MTVARSSLTLTLTLTLNPEPRTPNPSPSPNPDPNPGGKIVYATSKLGLGDLSGAARDAHWSVAD